MRYTKYLFTPRDLAIFFIFADFTISRKSEVLKDLFENHNAEIVSTYRDDLLQLRKETDTWLIKYETDYAELIEAQMIMDEVNGSSTGQTSEPDYYGAYFKLIKLRLLYTDDYCKIKMSTLLSKFRYQRRSAQLVTRIKRAMNRLGIVPQVRGYEICDIGEVDIHTMIMFRLATPDEQEFDDEVDDDEVTS
ncbi:MAG: hypothetical protein K2N38_03160 [Oscillospiraceae bacterium]|nr:hypothetical protein [Oscillospiraceae bacterium]